MRGSGRMGPTLTLAMLSVEPQWCGTLLSLCGRPDADAVALALGGPPLDPDWIAFAGSFGFEICSLSSTWALIFDAVKASGVILLLGVGSLVCYKLYNFSFNFRSRLASSESSSTPSPSSDSRSRLYVACSSPDEDVLVDEFDDDDSVQGCYFGPSGPHEPSENADKSESSVTTDDGCRCEKRCPLHHKNAITRKSSYSLKPRSTSWLFQKLSNVISCHVKNQKEGKALRPNQLLTSFKKQRAVKYKKQKDISKPDKYSKMSGNTVMKNLDNTQLSYYARPWTDDSYSEELITSEQPRLLRDESYDSLGFPKGMTSDASLDSVSSEISFDFSLPEMSVETSTMVRLEDLQQVINQIKTNCDNMSDDFESIKSNRNLPGMSSLMRANLESYDFQQGSLESVPEEQKDENARACFAGLYSLTVINNSTSSDMSDSCLNLDKRQGSFGSAESFEWDYPKIRESPITEQEATLSAAADTYFITPEKKNNTPILMEPELFSYLEWDDIPQYSEENGNKVETETYFGNTDIFRTFTVSSDNQKDVQSQDQSTETDSAIDSSMITSSLKDIQTINSYESEIGRNNFTGVATNVILSPSINEINETGLSSTFWHLDESGYVDWEVAPDSMDDVELDQYTNEVKPMAFYSSSTSELSTPLTEGSYSDLASPASSENANDIPTIRNIGERVDIIKYANQEWRGDTIKAANMLKGYYEIPKSVNLRYLRQIRGDNYCGVRATIVQLLSQGLSLPSGSRTYESLFELATGPSYSWIRDWTFASRLSYQGNSVLFGMQTCLNCLDNLSNNLSSKANGREEAVVDLLNCNPSLDLHVLEAVKLHMLLQAIKLYEASAKGDNVPLFALLMFSRDSSASPKAFMKNHLGRVGDSGGLEQIEMFLLGHTLSVALKVIRPSAYGTEEFICYFSESDSVTLPEVVLIAEDDRHYNILLH